jgi:hypothetical protein
MTVAIEGRPEPVSSVSFECRDIRHLWQRGKDEILARNNDKMRLVSLQRTLDCSRCGTQRIDRYVISRMHVEKYYTRYVYPKGYQIKGGFTTEEARIVLFSEYLK